MMLTNDEIDKYSAVRHYTVTSVTEKAPTVSAKIEESRLRRNEEFPPQVRTSSLGIRGRDVQRISVVDGGGASLDQRQEGYNVGGQEVYEEEDDLEE